MTENGLTGSSTKKWFVVFWYCLLQAFVTLTTTTYVSAEFLVQETYGGTTQVVALGQSMFIIGTAVGPAFLGPLSYVYRCRTRSQSRRAIPHCSADLAVQGHQRPEMGLRRRHLRLCHPQHRLCQGAEPAHVDHLPIPVRSSRQCGPV